MVWPFTRASRPHPFDPNRVLFDLTEKDPITLAQACQSFGCIGATGMGKSTGMMRLIVSSMLNLGAGVLWLTAKPGEVEHALKMCRRCGREKDVVVVGPKTGNGFCMLSYEYERTGCVEVATKFIETALQLDGMGKGDGTAKFFNSLAMRMINNAVHILLAAGEKPNFLNLYRMLTSLPGSVKQVDDPAWRETSFAYTAVVEATKAPKSAALDMAVAFFGQEFLTLAKETASSAVTTAMTAINRAVAGPFSELMSPPTNGVTPKDLMDGRIAILDAPVLIYREEGQQFQRMYKELVQREVLRRVIGPNIKPVLIVGDEYQFFVSPDTDVQTLSVCRESRLCHAFAFQNIPLIIKALGGDFAAKEACYGWLANIGTLFIGANGCSETNELFSKYFGKRKELYFGGSSSTEPLNPYSMAMGTCRANASFHEQLVEVVPASTFTRLSGGGPHAGFVTTALAFQNGRVWSNGKTHLQVSFKQEV